MFSIAHFQSHIFNFSLAGLEDALDSVDAGNFANIDEDGFELALIGDFQIGVHAGVQFVRAAFQAADIRAGAADHGGNFGEQAGTIFRADGELHGEGGFAPASPFDGDAALGLIHQILKIRTEAVVDGNAAAAHN